jgi:LysM repeat protein
MKSIAQAGGGFIFGAIMLLIVIGGISLAFAETRGNSSAELPTPSPIPTTFVVQFASPLPTSTPIPALSTATLAIIIPSATNTGPASACVVIQGNWSAIVVGSNDTLYSIAERYNTTVDELNQRNCLNLQNPVAGTIIFVPSIPATKVVAPCAPPVGWVKKHVVQAGENLYRIALSYGITYPQLQAGNCMGSSTLIFVGQTLWVPNVPTITPPPTSTVNYSTATPTVTRTPDFSTPTSTFVVTSSPVPTNTAAPSSTPSQ